MHPAILNLNQVELEPLPEALAPTGDTAGRYQQRLARIGQQLGAQKLGYRLYVLEPGMRGSPFHSHRGPNVFRFVRGMSLPVHRADLKPHTRSSITVMASCATWRSAPSNHRTFVSTPIPANTR